MYVHYILILSLVPLVVYSLSLEDYYKQRNEIKSKRATLQFGAELSLTESEQRVDEILLRLKKSEIERGIETQTFPPASSFFTSKNLIEASSVFKIIKAMPKGAALHLHDIAMVDPAWLVEAFTYKPECYVCIRGNEIFSFAFLKDTPQDRKDCEWMKAEEARRNAASAEDFDDLIIHHLTIVPENLYTFDGCCVDQNKIWQRAERAFTLLGDLLFVQPNLAHFWRQALTEFRLDGVQYVEPRTLMVKTKDYNGVVYDEEEYLKVLRNITADFVEKNSDFIGAKLIKCDLRFFDAGTIERSLQSVIKLRETYPDFLAGYDLVGQEDRGVPLEQYLSVLLGPSLSTPPVHLPYFFHAGETDWLDTAIDWNLMDAILLNSSRIGHGYSLVKHPHLLQLVKDRDIAVEVNPISNQVLGLVSDLRDHPVTYLLSHNVSVVVSSDDPSIWRSLPLSHDFYQIFMANTATSDGLRVLKKLALNSIRYSSMSGNEKSRAYSIFNEQWTVFIDKILRDYSQH